MGNRGILVLVVCFVLSGQTRSASIADSLSKGFQHFYNLEYDEAIGEFTREIQAKPGEATGYNHLAQSILYREMLASGALESELVSGNNPFLSRAKVTPPEVEQRRFDDAIGHAVELSEQRLLQSPEDAAAMYSLGVAHGLRANYNFLIRKEWREALREFTHSRKLHQKVIELRPSYTDAYLVEGVHDYIVGSLPFTWKMLGFIAGFRGDKDKGLRTVEMVAEKGTSNRFDAMILLAVAYRRERQMEKALPMLDRLVAAFPRNYLYRLEMVQMYGDMGRMEDALGVLRKMDQLRNSGSKGYRQLPLGKIEYARGNLLFWYRDYPKALENLRIAAAGSRDLDVNTGVNAWLRIGQVHDLLGEREKARQAYRRAIEGAPDSDAARESRRYLSSPYRRG